MIIDGKKIAAEIKLKLAEGAEGRGLRLGVVQVGDNTVSSRYVARKQKFGAEIGVEVMLFEYPADISESALIAEIKRLASDPNLHGLIIQLPLPVHIDETEILNLVPPDKDVDALGSEARVLNPTVSAIREILSFGKIKLAGRRAVVLGKGKLVGRPVAIWLTQEGAEVTVIDSKTADPTSLLQEAEIIISGVGRPGLIKPEMIKEGVVLIDAGTSESSGPARLVGDKVVAGRPARTTDSVQSGRQLKGDADPACAEKCALFTPVPGGVGPLTVAMLFKNLLELNGHRGQSLRGSQRTVHGD